MNKLRMHIFRIAAFALFVGAVQFSAGVNKMHAQSQVKPPQDVKVVNTPSQPIPTQAQGTTTVAGTVSLSPGTHLGIDPANNIVQFNNTATSPIFVRIVDSTNQPFQDSNVINGVTGLVSTMNITTVPVGKRLVIEHVSMQTDLPTGQELFDFRISITANGASRSHRLLFVPQSNMTGFSSFRSSQLVRFYADSGTDVQATFQRSSTSGSANYFATISGYLVDVPSQPQ